jgi:hypothetical protein
MWYCQGLKNRAKRKETIYRYLFHAYFDKNL